MAITKSKIFKALVTFIAASTWFLLLALSLEVVHLPQPLARVHYPTAFGVVTLFIVTFGITFAPSNPTGYLRKNHPFWFPRATRLRANTLALQSSLEAIIIEDTSSGDHSNISHKEQYHNHIRGMLNKVKQDALKGDLVEGWIQLRVAQRLILNMISDESLQAVTPILLERVALASKESIINDRHKACVDAAIKSTKQAINRANESPAPTTLRSSLHALLSVEAEHKEEVDAANLYRRWAKVLAICLLIILLIAASLMTFLLLLDGNTDNKPYKLLAVLFFGGLGGTLSAVFQTPSLEAQDARKLHQAAVNFLYRPVIESATSLVVWLSQLGDFFVILPKNSVASWSVIPLIAGFSERLFMGVVAKIESRAKDSDEPVAHANDTSKR